MLRFLSRFQVDSRLKSGWIEPLQVGGHAPFSAGLIRIDMCFSILYWRKVMKIDTLKFANHLGISMFF